MTGRWWMLVGLLCIGLSGCHNESQTAETKEDKSGDKEAHVSVRVEPARRTTIVETAEGLGRSEAIPTKLATLTPAVEGHVHELAAKQGDNVKKGQPIVELDQSVALADLAEKTATRDSLKAALVLLKSLPRSEERKSNELAIEQANVALQRAKAAAERLRPLLARHEVSEQQVFEADLAVTSAEIMYKTAEAQLQVTLIGPRPEAVAEAEAKIAVADGAVAFSKAHLDLHTIRSPIDGVLDTLTCHPGQTIAIGTPIGEVVDTQQIFVSVYLPSRSAQAVHVGQNAQVRIVESHSESSSESAGGEAGVEGKVHFVGRLADAQTGNLLVNILVENPEARIPIGQTMGVTITLQEHAGMLQVPTAAILDQGEGLVLTVIRDGKTVALHPELGITQKGWVAIAKTDLKEGEPVIVEGGYNLPEGTAVKIEEKGEKDEKADEHEAKAEAKEGKAEAKADKRDEPASKADEHEGKAEKPGDTADEHEGKTKAAKAGPGHEQ